MNWPLTTTSIDLSQPQLMGILNLTPDSFSGDGLSGELAVEAGKSLVTSGASIVDIGGESSRPGATEIEGELEWRRIESTVTALASQFIVSVDTVKPEVAQKALKVGAQIINDVSGATNPTLLEHVASSQAGYVLMRNCRIEPQQGDPIEDLLNFFERKLRELASLGIKSESIVLDPGLGFGWSQEENYSIIQRLNELTSRLDQPVLIGASRKRFVGALTGQTDPAERISGSVAVAMLAIQRGAKIVRVHDVQETNDALLVQQALTQQEVFQGS